MADDDDFDINMMVAEMLFDEIRVKPKDKHDGIRKAAQHLLEHPLDSLPSPLLFHLIAWLSSHHNISRSIPGRRGPAGRHELDVATYLADQGIDVSRACRMVIEFFDLSDDPSDFLRSVRRRRADRPDADIQKLADAFVRGKNLSFQKITIFRHPVTSRRLLVTA